MNDLFQLDGIFITSSLNSGILQVIEQSMGLIKEIKRIYYIYGVEKDQVRGRHAHKNLNQILICVHGKIQIDLEIADGSKKIYVLDSPDKVLLIKPFVWHSMLFLENDSVLLAIADKMYDESDYIRSYDDFKNMTKSHKAKKK
jgi:dTDP-4-dehydrorhamnose 3,5-epimerase-like enzyme